MTRILAEIGHSGWLKSTMVLAEVRLLLSKISKLRGGKLAGYVHYNVAQPKSCLGGDLEGFAILERHLEIHKTNSCR
jgi:hypothetical protein